MKMNDEESNASRLLANAGLIPHEYSIKCNDCPYGVKRGLMRISANSASVHHAERKRGHTCTVRDYGIVIARHNFKPATEVMF